MTQHQALRVADAVREIDVYLEQPCPTYGQGLEVRRHIPRPLILDEVINSVGAMIRWISDQSMDVINLKISMIGGLAKAREIRYLCVSAGIALTI